MSNDQQAKRAVEQLRHLSEHHGVMLTRAETRRMSPEDVGELYERHVCGADCRDVPFLGLVDPSGAEPKLSR